MGRRVSARTASTRCTTCWRTVLESSLCFSFRPVSGCLRQKADVVFLLDSSSAIGKDNCHKLEDILMDCRDDLAYSCPFCCFHQDACIQKADVVFMMGCEMSTGTTSTSLKTFRWTARRPYTCLWSPLFSPGGCLQKADFVFLMGRAISARTTSTSCRTFWWAVQKTL